MTPSPCRLSPGCTLPIAQQAVTAAVGLGLASSATEHHPRIQPTALVALDVWFARESGDLMSEIDRLRDLPLERLRTELSRQVQARDAILHDALAFDRAALAAVSDEERKKNRQRADEAMKRLQIQNRDYVWPLEEEIRHRERMGQ